MCDSTTASTFITAIMNVIEVIAAVATTKAWVFGSRFIIPGTSDAPVSLHPEG